jgi:hypothetical protein
MRRIASCSGMLEVRARATDRVDLLLANHLRQRDAELRGAHRAGEGDHHAAASVEMVPIRHGGVVQRCGVEMPEVMFDESRDRSESGVIVLHRDGGALTAG